MTETFSMKPATLDDNVVTSPPDIGIVGRFDETPLGPPEPAEPDHGNDEQGADRNR